MKGNSKILKGDVTFNSKHLTQKYNLDSEQGNKLFAKMRL